MKFNLYSAVILISLLMQPFAKGESTRSTYRLRRSPDRVEEVRETASENRSNEFFGEVTQAMQRASLAAQSGEPFQSGTLPNGGVFDLKIEGSQYNSYDYRGPLGGHFSISGDLSTGHGSVSGNLPSGSTFGWTW